MQSAGTPQGIQSWVPRANVKFYHRLSRALVLKTHSNSSGPQSRTSYHMSSQVIILSASVAMILRRGSKSCRIAA